MKSSQTALYPIKFTSILKEKVWGGNKLHTLLNKEAAGKTGESWEISGVDGNISVINNGTFKGKNLEWLLREYKERVVGEKVYRHFTNTFPLLFKFIDAAQDLSVQVHPDDLLAKERHDSFGKTEMWYILQADENARLILGFKENYDRESYLKALSEKRITEILNSIIVDKGDSFIIKPGTVHAIGSGVLLAEIQQTSDITYRIYDWDRPGTDGKMRELHTELALDAIDFSKLKREEEPFQKSDTAAKIGETKYFSVNKLNLSEPLLRNREKIDSFTVYMCVEGEAVIELGGISEDIKKGETVLIPAYFDEIQINTKAVSLLEVYIP